MRRSLLVAIMAMGCTEADLALEAVVHAEDPLQTVRERTKVERIGLARLTADGPPIQEEPPVSFPPQGPLAVPAVGERLQVVHEGPDATLLLWLDRQDLGRWAIDRTRGGARPGAAQGETGVWLEGGTEVELVDQNGDWVAVDVRTRDLEITAWVPGFDVGPYWIEDDGPTPANDWRDAGGFLRASAEILDAPEGEVLARVSDWGEPAEVGEGTAFLGVRVLDDRDDHRLVEVIDEGVTVVGWVLAPDVADRVSGGRGGCGGWGSIGGLGWRGFPALELPAGTPLYAGPDGALVGETVTARGWPIVDDDVDGFAAISVPSPWGSATVYVW